MKSYLFAAGAMLALASCGTVPTNPLTGLFEIPDTCQNPSGLATNMICAGTDLASMVANKPPPRRNFNYSEDDAFDLQLSSSLDAGLDRVTITVPDSITLSSPKIAAQTVPAVDSERIVFWLTQVRNTGGEIKACNTLESGGILSLLVDVGKKYLKDRLTYRSAENYHVVVKFDGSVEEKPIREIIFTPRTAGAPSCG